ncbi:response regulator [Sphingomonas montana]|uniref:response regulator n=1 Tax=Sphingomonas montana TaxID=1843236 RepID=UPI00096E9420|nr:response regulator [Sphingomonas montana]
MLERSLEGCHILVVEDEYMLADELNMELSVLGATVLGPAGTLEDAIHLIASEVRIDGAILDVNLGGQWAFPAADALTHRQVPFLFTTGYDQSVMPSRFADIVLCEKPINIMQITEAVRYIVHN